VRKALFNRRVALYVRRPCFSAGAMR
jgi:hypothetical protein